MDLLNAINQLVCTSFCTSFCVFTWDVFFISVTTIQCQLFIIWMYTKHSCNCNGFIECNQPTRHSLLPSGHIIQGISLHEWVWWVVTTKVSSRGTLCSPARGCGSDHPPTSWSIWEVFFSLRIVILLLNNNNNRVKTVVKCLSIWFIVFKKPLRNRTWVHHRLEKQWALQVEPQPSSHCVCVCWVCVAKHLVLAKHLSASC